MDLVIGDLIEFEEGAVVREAKIIGYVEGGYLVRDYHESFVMPESRVKPVWTRWDRADLDREINREWRETDNDFDEILARMGDAGA